MSASDPLQIAGIKGLVTGAVNLSIALATGFLLPDTRTILTAGLVGFCGYGLSLVMFVLALRHLGTARTGAYFSAAPFVGAAISLVMLGDAPGSVFWVAAALMGGGIWLHLTETHEHEHAHASMDQCMNTATTATTSMCMISTGTASSRTRIGTITRRSTTRIHIIPTSITAMITRLKVKKTRP